MGCYTNIKSLEIFLKALEDALALKRGYFIPIIVTTSSKFPIIKTIKLEVYCVDGSYKKCISSEKYSFNSSEVSKENATDIIIGTTIKNILRFYGI